MNKQMKNNMQEAVCQNSIASVRLITRSSLEAKVIHRVGDRTTIWDRTVGNYRLMKEYDDTILKYKGSKYTLKELSNYLCCSIEVDSNNNVWLASQIIIQYQEKPWKGSVESKNFKTDEEAVDAFNKLVEQNNMKLV